MIHIKFHVPAINISNTESRRVLSAAFFKSNYALLSIMNAHKFTFQDLYVLDLKPTTKACWESWGKMIDNRKYLNGTFLVVVVFLFLNAINMLEKLDLWIPPDAHNVSSITTNKWIIFGQAENILKAILTGLSWWELQWITFSG